jgi:hypothetical protein
MSMPERDLRAFGAGRFPECHRYAYLFSGIYSHRLFERTWL